MADPEIPDYVAAYAAGLLTAMGPDKLPTVATTIVVFFNLRIDPRELQRAAARWMVANVSPEARQLLMKVPPLD